MTQKSTADSGNITPCGWNSMRPQDKQRYPDGKTMLAEAIDNQKYETARFLLEKKASPDVADYEDFAPIHAAAYYIDDIAVKYTKLLIDHGADINLKTGKSSLTPLMINASLGHVETIKLLLENGADTDAECDDGKTALDYAREFKKRGALRLLMPYAVKDPVKKAKFEKRAKRRRR